MYVTHTFANFIKKFSHGLVIAKREPALVINQTHFNLRIAKRKSPNMLH